jgi:hypothetical protein
VEREARPSRAAKPASRTRAPAKKTAKKAGPTKRQVRKRRN